MSQLSSFKQKSRLKEQWLFIRNENLKIHRIFMDKTEEPWRVPFTMKW